MNPNTFLSTEEKSLIAEAIKEAEKSSSGEIRVHIERRCKSDVLDRAAYVFENLQMHKTARRNGVLFYLSIEDRKFAILGDAGINRVTPDDFWDRIKEHVISLFSQERYADGLSEGIRMAGEALKEHFPWQTDDSNELTDDISYGKEN
jgi:uncharacterized membrane protein